MLKLSRKKAFSLIEILLVLTVIITLLIVVFVIYPMVSDKMKLNGEIRKINGAMMLADSIQSKSQLGLAGNDYYLENQILESVGYQKVKFGEQEKLKGDFGYVYLYTFDSNPEGLGKLTKGIDFVGNYPKHIVYAIEKSLDSRTKDKLLVYSDTCFAGVGSGDIGALREKVKEQAIKKITDQFDKMDFPGMSEKDKADLKQTFVDQMTDMVDNMSDDEIKSNAQIQNSQTVCELRISKYQ